MGYAVFHMHGECLCERVSPDEVALTDSLCCVLYECKAVKCHILMAFMFSSFQLCWHVYAALCPMCSVRRWAKLLSNQPPCCVVLASNIPLFLGGPRIYAFSTTRWHQCTTVWWKFFVIVRYRCMLNCHPKQSSKWPFCLMCGEICAWKVARISAD